MQTRSRFPRLAAAGLALLLVFGGSVAPAAAWSNNGDGYGTHDWIMDQAFRLLTARGIGWSWVDRTVALVASDDPDNIEVVADPSRSIEHTYTGGGKRGGAIHRITEHYAAMLRLYNEGRAAQLAGDSATATAKFREASYNLGMLAHFYGDILQPYHTSRDAIGQDKTHLAYELLVDKSNHHPPDAPTWSVANTSWVVKDVLDVRVAALAAATYSRDRYLTLAANFSANDTSLSSAANTVTREVLIRASGDLANLVASVPKGLGNPPPVGTLTIKLRYRGVKANEVSERLDGTVLDGAGKPIEGVRVDILWPMADGTTQVMPFWTDELGNGHIYGIVASPTLMAHQTVTATVTTDQTTRTKTTWWYRTLKLADGTAGFVTSVNDKTVVAGQTVTVTTTAKSTTGSPIVGLLVTWTWYMGSTTVTTTGYTDSAGKARSSKLITSTTTRSTMTVTGRTSAYSINRSASTTFARVD